MRLVQDELTARALMGGLCAPSSRSSAAPSRSALVVGVLAVAGVIDDDPAPTRPQRRRRPRPPATRPRRAPAADDIQPARIDQRHLQARRPPGVVVRPGRSEPAPPARASSTTTRATSSPTTTWSRRPTRFSVRIGVRHQADPGPAGRQGPVVGPRGPEDRPGRGQGRPASRSSSATPTRSSRATRRSPSARRSASRARSRPASSPRSGARSRRPTASRSPTRSRPTRRSTPATPAARCSTATAA